MLRLAGKTRNTWIDEAMENLSDVLLDHAHCEKKRHLQLSRLSFGIRNTPTSFVRCLNWHEKSCVILTQVLTFMEQRDIEFVRQVPSEYAKS